MRAVSISELRCVTGGIIQTPGLPGPDPLGENGFDNMNLLARDWLLGQFNAGSSGGDSGGQASNSSGFTWGQIAAGFAMIAGAVAIIGTAGLATIPVGIVIGAGTAGEIMLAGVGLTLAGTGGAVVGNAVGGR